MPLTRKLAAALRAVTRQLAPGPNAARLEVWVDAETDAALRALAEDLAKGGGNPNTKRSAAARLALRRGMAAMLAEETTQA